MIDFKDQLIKALNWEEAHINLEKALEGISLEALSRKDKGFPYSIWQLVEHIRLIQWDIVEFSIDVNHVSLTWPDSFWPKELGPKSMDEYNESMALISRCKDKFSEYLKRPENELLRFLSQGTGQTLLREILLIIDHTSYHTGQIVLLRKIYGDWPI